MPSPRTSSLFHFTKSFDTLKAIIQTGFWPRYCREDHRWATNADWYLPMVCFCDIPFTRLDSHTGFYGNYGLGMNRAWGISNGLCPVFYVNSKATANTALLSLAKQVDQEKKGQLAAFYQVMSLTRPLSGIMTQRVQGKLCTVKKDFYDECEWRFVPHFGKQDANMFNRKTPVSVIKRENEKMKKCSLSFTPDDIRYILLRDEDDVTRMYDFLHQNLAQHSLDSIKRLTTRILVVSRLAKDV